MNINNNKNKKMLKLFVDEANRFYFPYSESFVKNVLILNRSGTLSESKLTRWQKLFAQKLFAFYSAFTSFTRGEAELEYSPLELHVEDTDRCNLRCVMCGRHRISPGSKPKSRDMEMELFDKLIPYMKSALVGRPTGLGEPLMGFCFLDMVRKFKRYLLNVAITTNATLLTRKMSEELIRIRLNHMRISYDAGTKETFEKIRINGNFEKLRSNLKHLFELKEHYNSYLPGIAFTMLGMRENIGELSLIMVQIAELGGDNLKVIPLSFPPNSGSYYQFYISQALSLTNNGYLEEVMAEAETVAGELGLRLDYSIRGLTARPPWLESSTIPVQKTPPPKLHKIDLSRCKDLKSRLMRNLRQIDEIIRSNTASVRMLEESVEAEARRLAGDAILDEKYVPRPSVGSDPPPGFCAWPWATVHIRQSGLAHPCCRAYSVRVGDLNHQDLKEIFNGEEMIRIRVAIARGEFPNDSCSNCYFKGRAIPFDNFFIYLSTFIKSNCLRLT